MDPNAVANTDITENDLTGNGDMSVIIPEGADLDIEDGTFNFDNLDTEITYEGNTFYVDGDWVSYKE